MNDLHLAFSPCYKTKTVLAFSIHDLNSVARQSSLLLGGNFDFNIFQHIQTYFNIFAISDIKNVSVLLLIPLLLFYLLSQSLIILFDEFLKTFTFHYQQHHSAVSFLSKF